jgi:SAM-dependent methyltransferase
MSFPASWLALREPYDAAARNTEVLEKVAAFFADRTAISVVDLACGTGATLRAVAPCLPVAQAWRLVDNDLSLLARITPPASPRGLRITPTPLDLSRDLELALDGQVDLVTTSAFFDLVSGIWLDRFLVELAARRLPLYAALTYDGTASCMPDERLDRAVIAAVNRHQLGDKGFGPALGPQAASVAVERLARLDYQVIQGSSDWIFAADDRDIQIEVVSGWAVAAREMGTLKTDDIVDWLARRRAAIAHGRASMRVGHIDFFAWPKGMR